MRVGPENKYFLCNLFLCKALKLDRYTQTGDKKCLRFYKSKVNTSMTCFGSSNIIVFLNFLFLPYFITGGMYVVFRLCLSILRVLGVDYLRPFPPLDWSFIRLGFADEMCREHVVKLCALQGLKSPTAQKLLQEFVDLIKIDDVSKGGAIFFTIYTFFVSTIYIVVLVSILLKT